MALLANFLRYISISTNSCSNSFKFPSTESQRKLAKMLLRELKELNLDEIFFDEKYCYIYALLKGNEQTTKIGFIAHMDTSDAVTDVGINPKIISNYNGENVKLNENVILDIDKYPDLKSHVGKTLITTDGTTLLGADDKAGIAEIMSMLKKIIKEDIPHGDIFVAFTPDEEIGNGTAHFDFSKFRAKYAYTVDGSSLGEISYENFNAASIDITIKGVSTHLGTAKNILVNSQLIANEIINMIPNERPETTEKMEGYYHLTSISGTVTKTELKFIIRDFEKANFEARKDEFRKIVEALNEKYCNCITLDIHDTYNNMKEMIAGHMQVVDNAIKAMKNVNVTPINLAIRGGTDGADLSYNGLPCPNIGTGGHNFHSVYEYICLEDMGKVVEILIEIVKIFSNEQ